MKTPATCICAAIFFLFIPDCVGQQQTPKIKVYNAVIYTIYQGPNYKGPLLQVTDSSLTILWKGTPTSIPSNSVRTIKFKRKAAGGRGAVAGGITGLALGMIIGAASGDDECPPGQICIYQATAGEKALAGGLVLSVCGSVVGAIIGSLSHAEIIKVNGNRETFVANKEKLRRYLFLPAKP